jgi:hypothetical protein
MKQQWIAPPFLRHENANALAMQKARAWFLPGLAAQFLRLRYFTRIALRSQPNFQCLSATEKLTKAGPAQIELLSRRHARAKRVEDARERAFVPAHPSSCEKKMDCRVKPGNDDRFNMIGNRCRAREVAGFYAAVL